MNRTEAIIILEGFKNNPLFNSTHAQALDMAIVSLKTDLQSAYDCGYNQACKDKIVSPYKAERGE